MATLFTTVYNRFLDKITDDMYMELSPYDTFKDLQHLLINAIPKFEFPRQNMDDYVIVKPTLTENPEEGDVSIGIPGTNSYLIDTSAFNIELSAEEIDILAILMKMGWIERQIASIEVTRMKYSGPDFKMTSQANHLSKLLALNNEVLRDSTHMQRLYKRRKKNPKTGVYESTWALFRNE